MTHLLLHLLSDPGSLSFKSDLHTSFEYGRNGLLKTACLVAEGELSIDMTDYLILGSVNIVRDKMCDCMSARNKNTFEKVQGVTGFSLLLLL